jgi:trans-aconitate methyltransferase
MERSRWAAYGDLAWTDTVVSSPEEARQETEYFGELIRSNSRIEVKTLLHLGCGAGMNDFTFKREFDVKGVDVSEGMLEIARKLNPRFDISVATCEISPLRRPSTPSPSPTASDI